MIDLCREIERSAARGRILAWLADGARELTWALCAVPRNRWTVRPRRGLGDWPALRHVRHLVLNERHLTLPSVRYILGNRDAEARPSATALDQVDAAWDPEAGPDAADDLLSAFAATRFELLCLLETAPNEPELAELMLRARQHELEHLATIWRLALYWDRRVSPATPLGVPFHPADRLEESH